MIAVVDYGSGNLHSVRHALETVGAQVVVTRDPRELERADRLVLPGVGAFGECIRKLQAAEVLPALKREVLEKKKPMFGICVGLQVLATESEELGVHAGLGWMPGRVRRLRAEEKKLRVPHIGWNSAKICVDHPVFRSVPADATFYFVHSFAFEPVDRSCVAATCEYGEDFVCAIAKDNIVATQFHPEKSQTAGLTLLANFLEWSPKL
jgi:imidazole glycerol-phosphate synthase subunit HisH